MTNQEALDARIWQAGFDEAMDRMAYWMDKIGYERDSILRLRGLIETGPVPETSLQAKRRVLRLPIEERSKILRQQAEALLRDKPDYGVEE